MAGFAVVQRGGVMILSPAIARFVEVGVGLAAKRQQANGITEPPPWLDEFKEALRALAGDDLRPVVLAESAEAEEIRCRSAVVSPVDPCRFAASECRSVTTEWVAVTLGVSEQWVRRLARAGRLGGHRGARGEWHIEEASVSRLQAERSA